MAEPPFTAETFQNQYLPPGAATVVAVVTVTAGRPPAARSGVGANDRAEVIVVDTSGSMGVGRKLPAAKEAARAALDVIEDGVEFAIVAGTQIAWQVWPDDGRALAVASQAERAGASAAIDRLTSTGGTAISTWLELTRRLFASTTAAVRHAILLTDGRNENEPATRLNAAVEACRGLFHCDCRGVGVDWDVEELRGIATALLGTVDIVADPADLAEDFRSMITSSQSRALPDVKLRLWVPEGATIESLHQVTPEVRDLSAAGMPSGPLARDFLLADWALGESRDYHVRIQVKPGQVGDEMLAGRVTLVLADGTIATQTLVKAGWIDDTELLSRTDRHVAHYTGQVELADAIRSGLAALKAGDERTATVELGRATQLAKESGHHDTLRLLAAVVDVDDAESGTVRLRKDAGKVAEMTLDARSSRTVQFGRDPQPAAGNDRWEARDDAPDVRPSVQRPPGDWENRPAGTELEVAVFAATDDEATMRRLRTHVDALAAELGYGDEPASSQDG